MDIQKISKHFPDLPILEIYNKFSGYSYDGMQNWFIFGIVSSEEWEAYQVIWRNLNFRYSSLSSEFQLKED